MTTKELEKIYEMACRTKGFQPDDAQFKLWKRVLGWCERVDLDEALTRYFTENVNFPMPAELRPLAAECQRRRSAKVAERTYLVTWQCLDCGVTRSGWIPFGDDQVRTCRGIPRKSNGSDQNGAPIPCGGILEIAYDARLVTA